MAINKNTPPNVVGEPFKEYVNGQIKVRQQAHGSGFKSTRSDKDLVYLNSRNAWVKMASSVDVLGQELPSFDVGDRRNKNLSVAFKKEEERQQAGIKKLQELGLDPNLTGNQLAKKAILFNGTSEFGNKTQPGGVASNNSIFNNSAYGFGGSDFGLQPMPGITSFVIGHNNIGSIRTATVNIRAHSPLQFGIINLLYIRLGYSVLVEWGNSLYLDNNGKLQKMGPTLIDEVWFKEGSGITPNEFNTKTEEKREQYNGNYDGFFGKITNFEYKFNTDGSYDIELKLISQGDVVESFRLDTISPEFTLVNNENTTEETQLDQNNLLNALYCFDPNDDELTILYDKKEDKGDLISSEEEKLERDELNDILSSEDGDIVNPYAKDKYWIGTVKGTLYNRYYLRFGYFLEFLKRLLPLNSTSEIKYPELECNVSLKNYSKNFQELISFDPNVCFINNGPLAGLDPMKFGDFRRYDIDGEPFKGTLLNIYIEGKFIEKTVKNLIDTQGKVTIFNLLEAICNGINRSLADVTALYPTLQDDYMVVIRDANLDVRTGEDAKIIDKNIASETIEIFGYNTSTDTPQSTFVKDFDFTTTISKELASMISTGATAGNTDVSEYNEFFSNLNKGLEDRFKTSNETIAEKTPLSDVCPRKKKTALQIAREKRQNYVRNRKLRVVEKDEDLTKLWAQWKKKYLDENTRYLIAGQENYLPYFSSDENEVPWERGRRLFISTLKNKGNIKEESKLPKNVVASNIGFIPMGVDLTLEGIGGMRIYNQLKVNGQYLPVGYPDELELVIIGIDHQIQNDSWTTKIRTYTKPSSEPYNEDNMEGSIIEGKTADALSQQEIETASTKGDPNDEINPNFGVKRYNESPTAKYLQNLEQQNGLLEDGYLDDITIIVTNNPTKRFKLARVVVSPFRLWWREMENKGLPITLTSAYRPVDVQERLSNLLTEPGRAASPGTSPHGWGGAIDLAPFSTQSNTTEPTTNLAIRQTLLWQEVASIGAKYGWYNPKRLSDKTGVDECWHFEYWAATDLGPPIPTQTKRRTRSRS